ncbi:MAG: outer membrane protein assembly factor BamA [Nitrospirae bacterium]|nr:outer membrane protein assembly factor BamA [Nitrospirota bacterium]
MINIYCDINHSKWRHSRESGNPEKYRGKILAFILLLTSYFLLPIYTYASDSDKVIRAIEVEGLHRIDKKELIELIDLRVGRIFDEDELAIGIKRAFRKGIFYDIQAVSGPYDGGTKLKYVVKEIPLIKKIVMDGNKKVSVRDIKKVIPYKEGDDFREEYLNKAKTDLLNHYGRKGFPSAEVTISAEQTDKPAEVHLNIQINEGPPLIINTVDIAADLRWYFKVSEGDIFDKDAVDLQIKNLKEYLKSENYFNPVAGPYEFRDGVLVVPVNKGQRLEMSFIGNYAVSAKDLKKEVPFFEDGEVTDEAVQEALDRMKSVYLGEGYYYAQVAAGKRTEDEVIKLDFIIFEGKKVFLKKIEFEGTSISSEAVKSIIPLTGGKPYNDNLLAASRDSVLRFYNALGYIKTDIKEIEKDFQEDGSQLLLKFIIAEGPQTKIEGIQFEGNRDIGSSEIENALQLKKGSPYNLVDIGDARYRIISLYNSKGYMDARVEVESRVEEDKAFITFKVTENRPSVIGKIIISGNRQTKAKIIEREFTVTEGDTYNYEDILTTKQRLYKLGIFNEVSVSVLETEKTEDGKLVRDMLVSLKEGNPGSVEISLGYGDYERFRSSLGINYNNLGGYHRQVGLKGDFSAVKERYTFSFKEPWLFNQRDLLFTALLIKEKTRSVNLDTRDVLYKIDRTGMLLGIEKVIKKEWRATLNYEYSFVDTKDVEPGVILSREDSGTIGIGSATPSLFYDTRDDPFDPTRGSLHGIVVKFASKALLSETEFIKGTVQSSWFFPVIKRVVFAFSLRGGAAYSYDTIQELPLVERFFLGGRTTVRGYSNDTLGPKGADDSPTGGNIFALGNLEFRIALGKGFGLVTFMDAGNVWQLLQDVRMKLKYTSGAGLRYKTPIGPISLDYGHKMNRDRGETSGELHFSFGHAF